MPDQKVFELVDTSEQAYASRRVYVAADESAEPGVSPPDMRDRAIAVGGAYGLAENGEDGYAFGVLKQFSANGSSGSGPAEQVLTSNGETPMVRTFNHSVPVELTIPAYDDEVDPHPSAPVWLFNRSAQPVTLALAVGVTLERPPAMGLVLEQGVGIMLYYVGENLWLLLSGSLATP